MEYRKCVNNFSIEPNTCHSILHIQVELHELNRHRLIDALVEVWIFAFNEEVHLPLVLSFVLSTEPILKIVTSDVYIQLKASVARTCG